MRPLVSLSALNTLASCTLVEPTTSAATDPNPGAAPVPLTDAELDAISAGLKIKLTDLLVSGVIPSPALAGPLTSIAAALANETAPGTIIGGGGGTPP